MDMLDPPAMKWAYEILDSLNRYEKIDIVSVQTCSSATRSGMVDITFNYRAHETLQLSVKGGECVGADDNKECTRHYTLSRVLEDHVEDGDQLVSICTDGQLKNKYNIEEEVKRVIDTYKQEHYESPNFSIYQMDNGLRAYLPDADLDEIEKKMRVFLEENEKDLN